MSLADLAGATHPLDHGPDADVEAFCRGVWPHLLGALTITYGYHVAEEIAQETLERVYRRWDDVRRLRSPESWAYRVAFNLASSWTRRRLAERRALQRAEPVDAEFASAFDRADTLAVRAALDRLSPRQRSALVLRYYADLPLAQIAEIMSCSQGTVKSHLRDGLAALRERGGLSDGTELR